MKPLAIYFRRPAMEDNFRHKGMRNRMIEGLRAKGRVEERVLEVMSQIPRHQFIDDSAFLELAYEDRPFSIGAGQTISQPYTVAFQSSLLQLQAGDKVLEIGTGSGYQTAVLCKLGAKVYSIERQRSLFDSAKPRLKAMGYRAELRYGDGYKGLPTYAPYDKVLVTCGAPDIPLALQEQLKPGGLMVVPVGPLEEQIMVLVEKDLQGVCTTSEHGRFRFVPMLEDRQNN